MRDATPDILLLDIDMPERDGWSFARGLRDGDHRSLPIIMISGHANEEGLHRPQIPLHDACITKPYNLDELLLQIAELLKLKLTLPQDTGEVARKPLSEEHRARLVGLAEIGHASALRSALNELNIDQMGALPLMRDLQARLDRFDMDGLIRALERDHAEG